MNFPANTGFAWNYIEGMYARIADHLAKRGIRTLVAYPSIPSAPRTLHGSAAQAIELDTEMASAASTLELAAFVVRENIQTLYLTDRPALRGGYAILRAAGVRHIVVHDHASGAHRAPRGLKRLAKWAAVRLPLVSSDVVVAVSDFVAQRQTRVGLIPPERVRRIYNSAEIPLQPAAGRLRALLDLPAERPIIACACRTTTEKGVHHLLRAFDLLLQSSNPHPRPVLVYLGNGPAFVSVSELHRTLGSRADIVLAGYQLDAAELLEDADICVVPSVWEEAFGLAVVEPMARGKLVIASRVGAIPELIEDGRTGWLVPPGDEAALSAALGHALAHPQTSRAMGTAAKAWVEQELSLDRKLSQLLPLLQRGFKSIALQQSRVAPPHATSTASLR